MSDAALEFRGVTRTFGSTLARVGKGYLALEPLDSPGTLLPVIE